MPMSYPLFGWDTPTVEELADFSDPSIQKYMRGAEAPVIDADTVDSLLVLTEALRGTGRGNQAKSACTYLRFAQGPIRPRGMTQAQCYHRAANDLRGVDALDKSAQCYYAAAASAFNEIPPAYPKDEAERTRVQKLVQLALRSAGRAKGQYGAIGMDDEADDAHRLQQEVLRRRYSLDGNPLRHLMWLWRAATGYGTSVRTWFAWLVASLVFFALSYAVLHVTGGIVLANEAPFTLVVTPIYLAVMNLVAFGAYTQIVPMHWLAELLLAVQAVTSFVLVGTGVTFLARR